jgi:hypothetical protein
MVCCRDTTRALGAAGSGTPIDPTLPQVTECRLTCDRLLFEELCMTDADCPIFFATGAGGGAVEQRCKPFKVSPMYPKGLGTCEVRDRK